MRRMLSALVLPFVIAGCGTLHGALPYGTAPADDSMGMTVEQYALGRLPGAPRPVACKKPSRANATVGSRLLKRCRTK